MHYFSGMSKKMALFLAEYESLREWLHLFLFITSVRTSKSGFVQKGACAFYIFSHPKLFLYKSFWEGIKSVILLIKHKYS